MILRGQHYSLHRECLASAPLPEKHRKLLLRAIRKLQSSFPKAEYSVIDYDLKSGQCRFLDFDCDSPWPEAVQVHEYRDTSSEVMRRRFSRGAGPVLTDQAVVLPTWNPYSSSAHMKLEACQNAKADPLKQKQRPISKLWREPEQASSIEWTPAPPQDRAQVCNLQCPGCYLALGKGKKSERHKTAIRRFECSRPVKNALRDKLIREGRTFLDYGCGQGEDVARLGNQGIQVQGWDPVFNPLPLPDSADIVNLGYVVNVIENIQERIHTLTRAYELASQLLIVAAYMDNGKATRHVKAVPFGDGVLTSRGTFQKLFKQSELRAFIESTLGVGADAADFGVYYVFKDDALRTEFLAHRSMVKARPNQSKVALKTPGGDVDEALLTRLAEVTAVLGRLPLDAEFPELALCRRQAGSSYGLQEQVFSQIDAEKYERSHARRKTEILVHLASSRLSTRGRPKMKEFPPSQRADLKALFTNYRDACEQADELLMQLGNSESIDAACVQFGLGKLLPDALYIHESLEDELPILLRLMVGCARNYAERELPENVSVLKLKRDGHGVTFIESEDFFHVEHPAVLHITKVKFLRRQVIVRDFSASENPTIYHRKELFLSPDHHEHEKFAELTRQEEAIGILDAPHIGRRNRWLEALDNADVTIEDHRVVSRRQTTATN